jgi:flagellar biosynthesis/type III secretory pathway chaperone
MAAVETIDDRANKSIQQLSQEYSQLLLQLSRVIKEEFQNLEKNQYNSSAQQLNGFSDEITSRMSRS